MAGVSHAAKNFTPKQGQYDQLTARRDYGSLPLSSFGAKSQ
jgi:hypothetical protein